jgi:hypothetical protein
MATELATQSNLAPSFSSAEGFALAQRIGNAFAQSDLVPKQYQGNVANCIVALEMANRMGASPLMVMQNLYIVHGNPGWSSKFLVACFNQCGRFSALRYEFDLDEAGVPSGCRAWAIEKATKERLVGSTVTIAMARAEGWSTKSGSKWKTMPELMLMYRAAAFMIRVYAPEISMGLSTDDEMIDVFDAETGEEVVGKPEVRQPARKASPISEALQAAGEVIDADTGEVTTNAEAKPEVEPATSAQAEESAAPAQEEAQAPPKEEAKPTPAPKAETPAKAPTAQTLGSAIAASKGEKLMIQNRAKSNGLDLAALCEQAGVGDFENLTRDGFIALRDLLPKSA